MPMKPEMLRRLFALALALLRAGPALADRPSLLDLQAALDGLVSPPPAAPSGTVQFFTPSSLDVTFSLVDLRLAADAPIQCTPTCMVVGSAAFEPVHATLVQTSDVALLTQELLTASTIQDVFVAVPSEPGLLHFTDVRLEALNGAAVPGRTEVEFSFGAVSLSVQGTSADYDQMTQNAGGCQIPTGEKHVDLAGNAPSNLQTGEIESTYQFGLAGTPNPSPALSLSRTAPNACYLRGIAQGQSFKVSFDRLWQSNDAFPGSRQSSETVDLTSVLVDVWALLVESGAVREEIQIVPLSGTLTTRDFSPVDGSETASQSAPF